MSHGSLSACAPHPCRRAICAGPLACAVLVACLLAAAPASADVRVGYIDSARIWAEYKDAQEAQQRFERQVQGWRDEAAEKEKAVNQLKAEVRDQGPVLSFS